MQVSKKFKVIGFILMIGLLMQSELFVTFYQSQLIFKSDKSSLVDLEKYYLRQECTYNLLLFSREKIIRNESLLLKYYTNIGSYEYVKAVAFNLDLCLENEN